MFINFARTLFETLIKDEFSYIKQADNRLVYETESLSLYKDKGSILYIVLILDGEKLDNAKYNALVGHYSGILNGERRAKLILMNVIVNDYDNKFLSDEDYMPEKNSYVFTYKVNLEKKEVVSPEEQPELLGLRDKIQEALAEKGEEYVNGTHLESLENELAEKYAIPQKSNNICLTLFIMALNVVVWLLMEISGGSDDTWTLISFGALSRNLIFNLNEYYRFFTAIFLHMGVVHLANNCLSLYIFGSRVEKCFGKFMFLSIYIASGLVGNIVTILFLPSLSVGASGAIFGLLGALLSVTYRTGRSVGELSPYLVLLLCVSSIGMGFLTPSVNNYAHIAGFITGAILGRYSFKC